jgi:hypothetical protein
VTVDESLPYLLEYPSSYDELDVEPFAFLGGHPEQAAISSSLHRITPTRYNGCIRNIVLNDQSLRLAAAVFFNNVEESDACEHYAACQSDLDCKNGGACTVGFDVTSCVCTAGFTGPNCLHRL